MDSIFDIYVFGLNATVLALGLALAFHASWSRRALRHVRSECEKAKRDNAEQVNFLSLFIARLQLGKGENESYNALALHVKEYVKARSACIFVWEGDSLRAKGVAGTFPDIKPGSHQSVLTKRRHHEDALRVEHFRPGEDIVGDVAASNQPLFIENVAGDSRMPHLQDIHSLIAVPLAWKAERLGVVCAVDNMADAPFSSRQLNALSAMSAQIATAVKLLCVFADMTRQQRIEQELALARNLQRALLPKDDSLSFTPFTIMAKTEPAKEVSGDFYDVVRIDDNRILVIVGDASGKGIPACMFMAMARSSIRANARRFTNLSDMLVELNANLYNDDEQGRFATLSCLLIDRKERTVDFARAGHTHLLIHDASGHVRRIAPDGPAVGLIPDCGSDDFDTISLAPHPGMTLLIFSDGISEALNKNGEEFGVDGLESCLRESCARGDPPERCMAHIIQAVADHTQEAERADDQTLLIIQCGGPPSPAGAEG